MILHFWNRLRIILLGMHTATKAEVSCFFLMQILSSFDSSSEIRAQLLPFVTKLKITEL